jgi:hypothetical protein
MEEDLVKKRHGAYGRWGSGAAMMAIPILVPCTRPDQDVKLASRRVTCWLHIRQTKDQQTRDDVPEVILFRRYAASTHAVSTW